MRIALWFSTPAALLLTNQPCFDSLLVSQSPHQPESHTLRPMPVYSPQNFGCSVCFACSSEIALHKHRVMSKRDGSSCLRYMKIQPIDHHHWTTGKPLSSRKLTALHTWLQRSMTLQMLGAFSSRRAFFHAWPINSL